MARISKAIAAILVLLSVVSASGCLHTWTSTYDEYPDSMYTNPHVPQGDPERQ
jgi:hypothetical protein